MPTSKLLLIFSLLLFSSCEKEKEAPRGYVDIQIYLNSLVYTDLLTEGGYMYFDKNNDGTKAGVNGIIVYRILNEFKVYDRACPAEPSCQISLDNSGIRLECPCCGSLFSALDGGLLEGSAGGRLGYYRTFLEGDRLQIFN